jgi:hypothetical protein
MSNPCKSDCDGALLRCAMLASSPTLKVYFGRCASCALHWPSRHVTVKRQIAGARASRQSRTRSFAHRVLPAIRLADFFRGSHKFVAAIVALLVLVPAEASSLMPKLDIGKGGQCVAEPQWMRKNHMKVLLEQRDETVHQGIRDGKFSLKNCIECHASLHDNSVIGRADSFCEGCHRYEAVKIDCFECHSSKRSSALAQKDSK